MEIMGFRETLAAKSFLLDGTLLDEGNFENPKPELHPTSRSSEPPAIIIVTGIIDKFLSRPSKFSISRSQHHAMVRSAADATRFTATGPYASSKPAPRSSSIDVSRPGQSGETAAEKIARLREAARLEKIGRESKFDRIVGAGRIWADRLHRVTALALIAFTGERG